MALSAETLAIVADHLGPIEDNQFDTPLAQLFSFGYELMKQYAKEAKTTPFDVLNTFEENLWGEVESMTHGKLD